MDMMNQGVRAVKRRMKKAKGETMKVGIGDHIYTWRFRSKSGMPLPIPYRHHGVYAGGGKVIHFCGEPGLGVIDAEVRYEEMDTFSRGNAVHVERHRPRYSGREAIRRAESRLGERGYDLRRNNCEHFATECCTGKAYSDQVSVAEAAAGIVGVLVLAAGSAAAVRRLQTVPQLA
jgi:hypothetical protein